MKMCIVQKTGVGRVLMHKKLQEFAGGGGMLFLGERGQERESRVERGKCQSFENGNG